MQIVIAIVSFITTAFIKGTVSLAVTSFKVNFQESVELNEGEKAIFLCAGEGDLTPQLTVKGQRSNVTLPMTLNPTNDLQSELFGEVTMFCNSTDVYTCTPSIGNIKGTPRTVSVSVRCEPEIAPKADPTPAYSTRTGNTLEMRFTIYAYPEPTDYTLFKTGNVTLFNKRRRKREATEVSADFYQVTYVRNQPPQGVLVVQMFEMQLQDTGQYSLDVQNGVGGGLDLSFSVTVKEDEDEDDDEDIHVIIATVCGVVGAVGVVIPGLVWVVKRCCSSPVSP